ncbi:MAG: phosphotransferase [Candidatus Aenigmarchaeota archaeon]|nr:phosphotransferase [Candidatus Aenigmarchaeota archaeon]
MEEFLSRVDIPCSLSDFVEQVASAYKLGHVTKLEPIKEGYEELNIKTTTKKGVYVIKVFSKGKTPRNIKDNIKGLVEFSKAGIPVTKLLKANGNFLYKTKGKKGYTYVCVMEFFDGKNFEKTKPTEADIKAITNYLAKAHHLSFKVDRNYDSWGTVNLVKEFVDKKEYLTPQDLRLIEPIVNDFRRVDFSKFRKSIIHGDLQRKHVLKNNKDSYCILDLGVMDFNSTVIDLGIFLALFCLDSTLSVKYNKDIYNMVIQEYSKNIKLSEQELNYLPLIIKATYSIYAIQASYYMVVKKDKSKQTRDWLAFGINGLKLLQKLN